MEEEVRKTWRERIKLKVVEVVYVQTYTATERATSADAAFCTCATGTSVLSLAAVSQEQSKLSSPAMQSLASELSDRGSQARSVSRRMLAASDERFGSNLLNDFMMGKMRTRLTLDANDT